MVAKCGLPFEAGWQHVNVALRGPLSDQRHRWCARRSAAMSLAAVGVRYNNCQYCVVSRLFPMRGPRYGRDLGCASQCKGCVSFETPR